jgi:hypothetical protein
VIGRVLGVGCGAATIVANEAEGDAGHSIIADPWEVITDWELRGRFRDSRQAFRARILIEMPGREAELEFLGKCRGGDGHDQRQIALVLESGQARRASGRLLGSMRAAYAVRCAVLFGSTGKR